VINARLVQLKVNTEDDRVTKVVGTSRYITKVEATTKTVVEVETEVAVEVEDMATAMRVVVKEDAESTYPEMSLNQSNQNSGTT
jgi:hypothetical protein